MKTEEIFDTFFKICDLIHKKDKIDKLISQNRELSSKCGQCNLWMTKSCPREMRHNVHCNELKCDQFSPKQWSIDLINKNNELIKQLTP